MRCDTSSDQPAEELAGAIGGVGGEPFGLKSQSFISPLDHRFRRSDLVIRSGWGFIPLLEYSAQDPAELSYRPGGASLHRPDPMTIVVTPSLVVELAYVKLPS